LFYQGIRPAISVGLSVSRVGGSAQTKALKSVLGSLRLALAQFRELAAFAQFGSDLDQEAQTQISRGQRLTELLKQPQYSPLSLFDQVATLIAANQGAFDDVPVEKLKDAQASLLTELKSEHKKLVDEVTKGTALDDETKEAINKVAHKVARGFVSTKKAVKEAEAEAEEEVAEEADEKVEAKPANKKDKKRG
jgi:F-type H+-transporting ATPase subunit alpha